MARPGCDPVGAPGMDGSDEASYILPREQSKSSQQQMLRENGWKVICAFGQTAEGKVVNEHTAMQITVVYACVISLPNSSQEF